MQPTLAHSALCCNIYLLRGGLVAVYNAKEIWLRRIEKILKANDRLPHSPITLLTLQSSHRRMEVYLELLMRVQICNAMFGMISKNVGAVTDEPIPLLQPLATIQEYRRSILFMDLWNPAGVVYP